MEDLEELAQEVAQHEAAQNALEEKLQALRRSQERGASPAKRLAEVAREISNLEKTREVLNGKMEELKKMTGHQVQLETDGLPPGWKKRWDSKSKRYYYWDIEDHVSQWNTPKPYIHDKVERCIDEDKRAYWKLGSIKFYETDLSWKRLKDPEKRTYWSNKKLGIRFFEPLDEVAAPAAEVSLEDIRQKVRNKLDEIVGSE